MLSELLSCFVSDGCILESVCRPPFPAGQIRFCCMSLPVIAEGVETEEEADILKENGVDRIQGYVYAKPMATEALLEFYHRYPV